MLRASLVVGLVALALVVAGLGGLTSAKPSKPVIQITYEPTNPLIGTEVIFTAKKLKGKVSEYRWNFDKDSEIERWGKVVTWAFAGAGDHPVTLIVVGEEGTELVTEEIIVRVSAITSNREGPELKPLTFPPSASMAAFIWAWRSDKPRKIWFDATPSGEDALQYEWDFGDGTKEVTALPKTSHVFQGSGTYEVTLTVTYPSGLQSSSKGRVTISFDLAALRLYLALIFIAGLLSIFLKGG